MERWPKGYLFTQWGEQKINLVALDFLSKHYGHCISIELDDLPHSRLCKSDEVLSEVPRKDGHSLGRDISRHAIYLEVIMLFDRQVIKFDDVVIIKCP
jgi:hypothetical protein